jgi:hypothetical protein
MPWAAARRAPVELVLAGAVAANLALEAGNGAEPVRGSPVWPLLQAAVTAAALLRLVERRDRLRLPFVLLVALAFEVGWIGLHLVEGMPSDFDSREVYAPQGRVLLSGHYPPSEYPPGAVLLFAFETLIGGGSARVSNAFVMVPFQLVTVWAVWQLRTSWAPWFATILALWPLNAFHVEFKFDALPTACAAVGLLLAWRGRWTLAGTALGIGAAVKWTPGLAAVGLAVWLLASRRPREALHLAAASAATFVLIHLPFVAANPAAVLHAYTAQSVRGITGESFPYLPLRALGLASTGDAPWEAAEVPGWGDATAIGVQAAVVAAVLAALVVVRRNVDAGIALAGLLPVAFLLTNRVFSPQFMLPLFASWAIAGALLWRTPAPAAVYGLLLAAAGALNALVYPVLWEHWTLASAGLFASALAATAWSVRRAVDVGPSRTDLLRTTTTNQMFTGMKSSR